MLSGRSTIAQPTGISKGVRVVRDGSVAGWEFFKNKPLGGIGALILILLVLMAIFAPVISPYEPNESNIERLYASPGPEFLLGSDSLGRDVLTRLFYGGRISLYVGLVSIALGVSAGSLLGAVSAYYGGKFDLITQRLVDAFIAFPGIILGLALMAALGSSVTNIIIALVAVLTPSAIRTVRSQALAIKETDYILAARAIGAGDGRIIIRHMVPNCMAIFIILATLNLGYAIIVESSLSFLGVGVPPDVPTWGSMLSEVGVTYIELAPWLAIFPGLFLSLAVFGVNLFGDALRDVLDPRLRGTG
jgi:peptide/nickel transport system permease protein